MRQKIELGKEERIRLAKVFEVSLPNICQALLFRRNSVKACQIREAALKCGGKLIQMNEVPSERAIKVLNQKGEVIHTIISENPTVKE